MLTREQFLKHLRDALNHLYDPDRLRRSPLAALFGVADRFDAPSRLQTILTEAIEALKPSAGDPPQSPNRRIYDLLLYRYVQQFSQHEVADQLGVSVRHLRREQHAALETLACQLWEQFHLEIELGGSANVESGSEAAEVSSTVDEELAWLKDAPPESPTDLGETLPAVLELIKPLATQHGVQVDHIKATGALPKLAMHPVAVRQTLLNLLSAAIHRASGGQVRIRTKPLHWEVEIQMQCRRSPATSGPIPGDEEISLDIARRLVELSGGRLVLSADEGTFAATLTLPALEQLPVLAIDDNADTLQLLQRYTAGTRYRLIGTQDPEQALSLAEESSPQVIVLDVMMPQVDGWEVLGWLRQHPLTRQIPIVVCTIMAQEELALSLGASSFVRKPITRQAFLAALDRQV
jgi:CheY-like chemotaxis protein/signal transduction histidine kinase